MTALKLVLLYLCICFKISLSESSSDNLCLVDLDLEKYTIQGLIKITSANDDKEYEENLGCLWKNKGLVTEYGILSVGDFTQALEKEFKSQFPDDVAEKYTYDVLNFCKDVKGKNPGDTAARMLRCIGRWKVQYFINREQNQPF